MVTVVTVVTYGVARGIPDVFQHLAPIFVQRPWVAHVLKQAHYLLVHIPLAQLHLAVVLIGGEIAVVLIGIRGRVGVRRFTVRRVRERFWRCGSRLHHGGESSERGRRTLFSGAASAQSAPSWYGQLVRTPDGDQSKARG